jgi:hypothetical protein
MKKSLLSGLLLIVSSLALAQSPTPAPATEERSIYLPYEKLEQVFEHEGRGVFLPYKEFLEMWNKVNLPEAAHKSNPPVDGILSSAHYTGKVSGDVVTLQAKLDFEALKEGWSSLSLGTSDLNVSEAKTSASFNFSQSDGYQIIFSAKGKYTLDMTVLGKITKDAGRNSVKLTLPRTAVSQFEMTVPDKGLDFTITPACAFTTNEQPDGSTKLAVFFGASQEVNISWQKRGGETALQPLLFVETAADTRISAGAVHTSLTLNYRILRSGVDKFEVLIPNDQQVLSVDGQNLRDWTLDKSDGRQLLVVNLHTPARDSYTLGVTMESPVASLPAKIALPLFEARNVVRQSGAINLSRDAELTAEIASMEGLTQQLAGGGGKEEATRVGQYRYLRLPYAMTANAANAQPIVEVTSNTLLTVTPELRTLRGKFHYDVKKAGIFSSRIELPDGFDQAEAASGVVESFNVQKVAGKSVLEVKFNSRRIGGFDFEVTADAPRKTPDEAVTVPVFRPLEVQRHEGRVGVAVHVSLKASTADPGDLRQEDVRNLGDLQVAAPDSTPLTLGFRYHGDIVKPAQLAFELQKPRVSAEVLALMEVRESLVKNTWWIDYNVEYAGVNEFSVAVPKEIADDLQIDGPNIKERSKSEDPKMPGLVIWKVSLQDKNLGAYELKLSLERPRAQLKADESAPVLLPEIKPLDLFRETGQIAVLKDGNLEFTKTDTKGTEVIDTKELHGQLLEQNGIFLAYKYAAHPVALSLDVSKNLYLEVPSALVNYAVINSVIAEDKAQTTEVVYWVRNNSQQFFTIRLPENGKMLADVYVNGEMQQPSKRPSQNEMLIRLPVQQGANTAFPVRFVYEVPSPKPGSALWPRGTIEVAPPVLTDAAVIQTQWTLYLPSGYRYVKFSGSMRERLSQQRGWNLFHRVFDRFVPNFGLFSVQAKENSGSVPQLAAGQNGGVDFQIPHEGVSVVLHRLDAPSQVAISYRSLGWSYTIEAILFFAALYFGLRLMGAERRVKLTYVFCVGVGSLIIAGAVDPRGAEKWQAIYLGVLVSVLIWLSGGILATLQNWVRRIRTLARQLAAKKVPPPQPPPMPPPVIPPAAQPPPAAI